MTTSSTDSTPPKDQQQPTDPPLSTSSPKTSTTEYQALSQKFNPFDVPPLSPSLVRPPVHSIPLSHYEISKKPLKLKRHNTSYYLIPVTHNSLQSYHMVNKVCKLVNPDFIAVELARLDDVAEAQRKAKEQALACQLGEFEGRTLVFMDRPIEFTRQSQKLYWHHSRIRGICHKLWADERLTPDEAQYFWFFWKFSAPYLLGHVLPVLSKRISLGNTATPPGEKVHPGQVDYHAEFDKLLEIGIFDAHYSEREQYMVQKLREIADAVPEKDQVVMAVVGQLHVPHLKFYWDRDDLLSTDDLCSFVAPRTVNTNLVPWQVYYICMVAVILLARAWHFYRMPRIERPKWKAPLTFLGAGFWTTTQLIPAATMYSANAAVGLISSTLVYSSYARLRRWGIGRFPAVGMTSLPLMGYTGWKCWKMKKNLDRAQQATVAQRNKMSTPAQSENA